MPDGESPENASVQVPRIQPAACQMPLGARARGLSFVDGEDDPGDE